MQCGFSPQKRWSGRRGSKSSEHQARPACKCGRATTNVCQTAYVVPFESSRQRSGRGGPGAAGTRCVISWDQVCRADLINNCQQQTFQLNQYYLQSKLLPQPRARKSNGILMGFPGWSPEISTIYPDMIPNAPAPHRGHPGIGQGR